jgi:NNP family nitrate/nitrite transporter-like MFS transporter
VPFVNRNALGGVAGIVGAGGNVGAVAAGFLVKGVGSIEYALSVLGGVVVASALCALAVRFTQEQKIEERRRYDDALAQKATQAEAEGVADVA